MMEVYRFLIYILHTQKYYINKTSQCYATAVGLVMDGLKRQERIQANDMEVEAEQQEAEEQSEDVEPPVDVQPERKSFLDKLTERVKEFLDNAE